MKSVRNGCLVVIVLWRHNVSILPLVKCYILPIVFNGLFLWMRAPGSVPWLYQPQWHEWGQYGSTFTYKEVSRSTDKQTCWTQVHTLMHTHAHTLVTTTYTYILYTCTHTSDYFIHIHTVHMHTCTYIHLNTYNRHSTNPITNALGDTNQ